MNILCKIGIHKWREVGFTGFAMPAFVNQCERCKIGRVYHFTHTETFTAEQMLAAAPSPQESKE